MVKPMAWPPRSSRPYSKRARAVAEGYRSGLEEQVAQELQALGLTVSYETDVISYQQPAKPRKYHPDFKIREGLYVETKGRFVTADRQKHLLIKEQYPNIEIRFVFSNSKTRISKKSTTRYCDWCDRYGFVYADKHIPKEWLS